MMKRKSVGKRWWMIVPNSFIQLCTNNFELTYTIIPLAQTECQSL